MDKARSERPEKKASRYVEEELPAEPKKPTGEGRVLGGRTAAEVRRVAGVARRRNIAGILVTDCNSM